MLFFPAQRHRYHRYRHFNLSSWLLPQFLPLPSLPPRPKGTRDSASIPPPFANTYPPPPIGVSLVNRDESRDSMASYAPSVASNSTDASTTYSKKARPESLLLMQPKGPIVCGIALVDFNHLVSLCILRCYNMFIFFFLISQGWAQDRVLPGRHLQKRGRRTDEDTTLLGFAGWRSFGASMCSSFIDA